MSDSSAIWQDLISSALLGTERHLPKQSLAVDGLASLLNRLDPSDPPHFLLGSAAAISLYRQVGQLPVPIQVSNLPICEIEEQTRCRPAAASRLAAMLAGQYSELIPEWLSLAAKTQRRVTEELLADLLEWGENHLDYVEFLLPVIGKRGRWLAKQIPWGENVGAAVFVESLPHEAIEMDWQTRRGSVRRRLLLQLRKSNPELARALVASTWDEDGLEDRVAFLKIFKVGLSMADEPFLEAVLDDRGKRVRADAAILLAQLPESRLAQRQLERGRSLLRWKPGGFLRKAQIEVTLPEIRDDGMLRDGIEPNHANKSLGEKGDWLSQILIAVTPSAWNQMWEKSPDELLETAGDGDWKELLHESWIVAAGRYQDPDWAEALLRIYPRHAQLLQVLPPQRRLEFLAEQIRTRPKEGMNLVVGYKHAWGAELTRLALPHLREYFLGSEDNSRFSYIQRDFIALGQYMEPSLTNEVAKYLLGKAETNAAWIKAAENLVQRLDFRQRMREELR